MTASQPHSSLRVPQQKIREPLAVVFDYAMRDAGPVASRREEVLGAANTIIERYAELEEQLEALRVALQEIAEDRVPTTYGGGARAMRVRANHALADVSTPASRQEDA